MSAITIDDKAVIWSAPENGRAERPLIILLHGYGSHEGDLFGLAPYLPLDPVIASLRAPLVAPHPIDGWSWFPLHEPGKPDATDAAAAAHAVLSWIDELPYTPERIALVGFSQGGALALQLLRLAPERFTCAVNIAGFVVNPEGDASTSRGDGILAERRPPVFWGRGTSDTVISPEAVAATEAWLPSHSTLDARVYEGLAHSINEVELADIREFLGGEL